MAIGTIDEHRTLGRGTPRTGIEGIEQNFRVGKGCPDEASRLFERTAMAGQRAIGDMKWWQVYWFRSANKPDTLCTKMPSLGRESNQKGVEPN